MTLFACSFLQFAIRHGMMSLTGYCVRMGGPVQRKLPHLLQHTPYQIS